MKLCIFFSASSFNKREGHGRLFIAVASNRWRADVKCNTCSPSRRIFFRFRPVKEEEEEEEKKEKNEVEEEERKGERHESAPSKIIPWSVSWHPMIVRQRLEWSVSLRVHVRLARVSCGATLPIPGCLQDCNIVSGRGRKDGRNDREEGGGGEGKKRGNYNHTLMLASSGALSFVLTLISLLLSHYPFLCTVSVHRTEYYSANYKYRQILIKCASKGDITLHQRIWYSEKNSASLKIEVCRVEGNCRRYFKDSFFNTLSVFLIIAGKITNTRNDKCPIHYLFYLCVIYVLRVCNVYLYIHIFVID